RRVSSVSIDTPSRTVLPGWDLEDDHHGIRPERCRRVDGTWLHGAAATRTSRGRRRSPRPGVIIHWQPGNLKLEIQVLQLKVPLDFRYSVVYQNVQSSTGSTVLALTSPQ